MTTLAAALGVSGVATCVPPKKTRAWRDASRQLHAELSPVGIGRSFTSWQGMWSLLHGTTPPASCTWPELISEFTLHDLACRIRSRVAGRNMSLMAWNVRRLVDPNSRKSTRKKAVVVNATLAGQIVGLTETHWEDSDAACWRLLYLTCTVLHAPAVTLPGGRPKGGVALIVPSKFTVETHSVIVDGCVLTASIRDKAGGDAFTIMVVYMPPGDHRIRVVQSLTCLPHHDGDTFAVGDFKLRHLPTPRRQRGRNPTRHQRLALADQGNLP